MRKELSSSESSFVSTFDNLTLSPTIESLSLSSPTSSSASQLPSNNASIFILASSSQDLSSSSSGSRSESTSESEYEVILLPSPEQRKRAQIARSKELYPDSTSSPVPTASILQTLGAQDNELTPKKPAKPSRPTTKSRKKRSEKSVPLAVTSSAADSGSDVFATDRKKTRRGGYRNRMRTERAQVRNMLDLNLDESTDQESAENPGSTVVDVVVETASVDSEDEASRFLDQLDLEHSVTGDLVVQRSTMSAEDAASSIDNFLNGDADFLGDKANKLRLWQAICIELGLVQVAELPDLPGSGDQHASKAAPIPFPTSMNQARRILKGQAHVNLADYLEARAKGMKEFQHLLHPSKTAMVKYTRKERRYVALDQVKGEWLDPLLKDFGIKRARAAQNVV